MDVFNRLLEQARAYWAGLSAGRRVGVALSFLGALLALGAVVYLSPGSRYTPLGAGPLPPEDVSAMRTRLSGDGIPFRLGSGGTVIEVPDERYAEAVVSLAGAGIPARGGKGFEVFDETSLMTTPFVQSVNYQRALQAELARSIMQMESVQSARVMIAKPEPSPFVRDQKTPTASVVIKLKPRMTMNPATASAIVSLVAHSIEGLRPENVTVMETGGRLLSDPNAAARSGLPTPQLEYIERLETYLSTKAEEMLSKTLGPGRAVIRVSADVNFQKIKERVKTYSPDGRVGIAERTANSTSSGTRAGGVTGATANITRTGGTTANAGSGGGTSKEEVIQTDYLVSETLRDIEEGSGAVTRLSVAALVDLTAADGQAVISQADAEEIIRQAVGFRPGRDSVTIARAPLTGPNAGEPDDTLVRLQRIQTYVSLARNLSVAFAAVLSFLVIGLLLLRRRPVPEAQAATGTEPGAETAAPTGPVAPTPPPTTEERRNAELIRFQTMARNEPAAVVHVLSVMLGEKSI
ncbi:flagellar basal-body MS-ring/collar protein FliF [Gemmata sp. JC717]|uniref:flagellar basal-body MS-ring/collar protein FliF n=1 Tax=Gemmata algarum TaxID=2975278 RepID=UPI0021BB00E5|nr:flagellar basal-body MS-ring/collar protein FliF [Gemmata algarum]MDY3555257.1 flagellar basal-body MS-ring/collar protein FliF [Gemmata algarum]